MNTQSRSPKYTIAKLVRAYVSQALPGPEAAQALRAGIRSPNDIIRCETIPESHELKRQAILARDALEAVTNGMDSDEALAQSSALGPDSVVYPWVLLAHGLRAFQNGGIRDAGEILGGIPRDCLAARAKDILDGLTGPEIEGAPGSGAFRRGLYQDGDILKSLAEEMYEALDEGLVDFFLSVAARLLRETQKRDRAASEELLMAIWEELARRDLDPPEFETLALSLFGEPEYLRLKGLSLADRQDPEALCYLVQAAALDLARNPKPAGLNAWALLLGGLARECAPLISDGEAEGARARADLGERLTLVCQRLRPAYAASLDPASESLDSGIGFLLELGRHYATPTRKRTDPGAEPKPHHQAGTRHRISAAREKGRRRQLELF